MLVMMSRLVSFVRSLKLARLGGWEVDEFGILVRLVGW